MAPRGKEMSTDTKKCIVKLSEDGVSGRKIAQMLGMNSSTIHKFLKRYRQRGNEENKGRSGRPRKCSDRTDRQLLRIVKTERRKNLKDVTNLLNERTPVKISESTVKRRLKFHGIKKRVVKKRIVISDSNRFKRRAWCRSKLHMTVNNYWKKIIFSDETQICIGKHSKVHIWRKDDEKWLHSCLGEKEDETAGPIVSVMFWGCITFDGVGTFLPVNGTINSQKYTDILDENLWPVVAKVFPDSPWIFQDDNATPHRSRHTVLWKQNNDIPGMMWPAQSPDINIIENIWRYIKIRLQKVVHRIKTKNDLIRESSRVWMSIDQTYVRGLYASIPTRIRRVLRANGTITKY